MAIRFYSEFSTERGNTWRVNIHDTEFSGEAEEYSSAAPGFVLSYFGGKDVFSPLMPSTCSLHMMVQTDTQQALLTDLADFAEGKFIIEVREDPDGTDLRHWLGMLTPESVRIPDQARPFAVELEAICGLATLSRQDYDPALIGITTSSTLDHLLTSLAGIPQQRAMFATTDPYLLAPVDIEPVTGTAGQTFLEDVSFGAVTYDPELGQRTVGTAEDMLVQICVMFNARLFMYRGTWLLMPVAKVMSTASLLTNVLSATKDGAVSSGSNIVTPVNFNQSDRHRLGGEFYYLPAVRKITREIDYFGNTPFAGSRQLYPNQFRAIGHTFTGEPTSLTISGSAPTEIAGDNTLKVRGFCAVILPWDYTSNPAYDPQSRLSRWRIELKVQCGNKYLKRNIAHDFSTTSVGSDLLYDPPGGGVQGATIFNASEPDVFTWTTDSASRVHFWTDVMRNGHQTFEGDPISTQIDWQFLTPTLGSAQAASVTVTMQVRGYNGVADASHPNAYTAPSSLYNSSVTRMYGDIAVYIGDGSDNGDVLTFGAELNNGATEEMRLPVGFYAEGPSDDVYNFSSAALTDPNGENVEGFTSHNTTATTPLATLLCIDRLEHFGEQQECYKGDFQSEIILNPILSPRFLSKNWMITSMRHEAVSDLYDLDLTAVKTLGTLDPDEVDAVRESIELVHSVSDSITSVTDSVRKGRRDLSEQIADVETDVANVTRTSGAGGGESSVQLSYLGDVKISGPTDGQVIEYNSAAGRWANVTPSSGGVSYHDRYSTEAESLRSGASANVELYYTARPDGDGIAESPTSDSGVTDTINRTLYFSDKFEADPNTATDWTEYTTQPADNATFTTAKAALLLGLNQTDGSANTRGTLPVSLKIVRTTSTPTATMLLDVYPGATIALSVRKLDADYTGYCMKIRRSSDNAELDIGFDSSGNLDTSAIVSHCSGTIGYCTVWYDQSSNSNNVTQTTSSLQPIIYNAGAVITQNTIPALSFATNLKYLSCSSGIDMSNISVSAVYSAINGGGHILGMQTSNNDGWRLQAHSTGGRLRAGGTNVNSTLSNVSIYTLQTAFAYGGNGTTYINQTGSSTISATIGTTTSLTFRVGTTYNPGSFAWAQGVQQEVIVWPSSSVDISDRTGVESNVNSYFSVFS
jgi:hypothetical protein